MAIKWVKYLATELNVLTYPNLERFENSVKFKLPEEYKKILLSYQGMVPDPHTLETESLAKVSFGPIYHIQEEVTDEALSCQLQDTLQIWQELYPELLPIADSFGTGNFFAYDYRKKIENPPVVFVAHDYDPEDPDAITYVAGTLIDLLGMLK
jgi:hypothetical protein